jgi:Ca2+-binding EF-hand superfamily protein
MKNHLLSFFSSLSALEEQVEVVKHVLCERSSNNLYPIFQYLDQDTKGFFDFSDLHAILTSLHRDKDISKLIEDWSISISKRVTYQDFLYWVLPLNTFPMQISSESKVISFDQKYSIQRVFSKEIDFQKNFSDIKAKFKFHIKKSLLSSFDYISQGQNSFTRENLLVFLTSHGINITESNVFAMMRRLDRDADGLVSVSDFVETFCQEEEFSNLSKVKSSGNLSNETKSTISHALHENSLKPSKSSKISLKKLIKGFIHQEKVLETSRREISFRVDFSIGAVFKSFDRKHKKILSELDMEKGLKDFGIRTSANNIFLIFRHFDSNEDGFLSNEDFEDMLVSTSKTHQLLVKYRDPHVPLSVETKAMLTQIFLLIIELEHYAENLRREVVNTNSNLNDLFQVLDVEAKGSVSVNDFRELLKKYSIQPTINDLKSLVKRFDLNKDGKVSYSEFINQVIPKASRFGVF